MAAGQITIDLLMRTGSLETNTERARLAMLRMGADMMADQAFDAALAGGAR